MRYLKLITAFALAALALVACSGDGNSPATETTAAPIETEAPVREIVLVGGEVEYTVVRPEAGGAALEAAVALHNGIATAGGKVGLSDDWLKTGVEPPAYEILVGEVDRPEVRTLMPQTPYEGYLIKLVGEKLVIVAGEDKYLDDAVEYLLTEQLKAGRLVLPEGFTHTDSTQAGSYPLANALLGETPINQFAIKARYREQAEAIQTAIGRASGYRLPIVEDASGEHLIIADSVKDEGKTPLGYDEFYVVTDDRHVYLYGRDECALGQATMALIEAIEGAPSTKLALGGGELVHYVLPDRAEYVNDPTKLRLRWTHLWDIPELPDYETMKADLFGGKGSDTLYTMPHRAEWGFYPENSLEACISAYYMGAAILELDFVATRDGVLILSHDDSLARMTNCQEFIGKPGYPTSPNASEWTLEQIRALNLKEGGGGSGAPLTPFKIATLEEVLAFTRGRMFIVPDKQNHWQYVKSSNIMAASEKHYLVDVMKKTGNFESIIISYGKSSANYLTAPECVQLQKLLFAETGVYAPILVRVKPTDAVSNYTYLEKNAAPGTFTLQINGDYRTNCDYHSVYRAIGDKVTMLAWTIGTGDGYNDYADIWNDMYAKGVRVIMTNDLLRLSQFVASLKD